MKQIQLYRDNPFLPKLFTIVDDEDYLWLGRFTWCAKQSGDKFYARTYNGKTYIYLHTLLLPSPSPELTVDHINLNTLDNRRENLRLATKSQQQANRKKHLGITSKYRGVYYSKKGRKWCAQLACKGVTQHLGSFDTEVLAAKAYNRAAVEAFGEFAQINELEKL